MAVKADDIVINILLKDKEALESLKSVTDATDEFGAKVTATADLAETLAAKYQVSADKIVSAFKIIRTNADALVEMGTKEPSYAPPRQDVLAGTAVELNTRQANAKADAARFSDELYLAGIDAKKSAAADESRIAEAKKAQLIADKEMLAVAEQKLAIEKWLAEQSEKEENSNRTLLQQEAELAARAKERGDAFAAKVEADSMAQINKEAKERAAAQGETVKEKQREIQQNVVLTENEKKLKAFEDSRLGRLQKVVKLRAQEVASIKAMPGYLNQVAAAEKLIESISEQSGSNYSQVAEILKKDFGLSADVASQSLVNLTNKTKGFSGILADTIGNVKSWASTLYGIFTAMFAFQLVQLVSDFFSGILTQAKEFGNALQQLKLAEKILSERGVDITNRQLIDLANNLATLYKTTPRSEIMKSLSEIALKLEEAGLSVEKIGEATEVVLDLKIRNPDKSISELTDIVTRALLTEEQKALTNLGIVMNENLVKQYAVQQDLITDQNQALTEQEQIRVRLAYLVAKDREQQAGLLEQQDSLVNAGDRLNTSWKNFTENFSGVTNTWNAVLVILSTLIDTWGDMYQVFSGAKEPATKFQAVFVQVVKFIATVLVPQIMIAIKTFEWLGSTIDWLYEKITGRKIEDELNLENLAEIDTPTNPDPPDPLGNSADETEKKKKKIEDNLRALAQAMDEFGDKARQMAEDFNISMRRLWEDYQHDLDVLNQDTNQKVAEANHKHRQKELENEAKFLEKLRQLREKFLFNLEDALRERDARQVLRLTRQYEMDKQALINEEALRKKTDAQANADDIAKIKADAQRRAAELEYEFRLKRQREEENFNLEMKRLKEQWEDKLRQIADGIANELDLNQEGAEQIYKVLSQIYGKDGGIDKLVGWTYESATKRTKAAFDNIVKIINSAKKAIGSIEGYSRGGRAKVADTEDKRAPNTLPRSMASGGLIVTNTPTDITMGDAGAEAGLFMPLDKVMQPGRAGYSAPAGANLNGKLQLIVDTSPDLVVKIVDTALGEVADVLEVVRRENR